MADEFLDELLDGSVLEVEDILGDCAQAVFEGM
jgi:hypothetical protein